jgi:hypothetical protein
MTSSWVLEGAANPTILRIHVTDPLTDRTIVTCPPNAPPPQLGRLLDIEGVRSVDLHRYRVRLNLLPDAGRGAVTSAATALLRSEWGDPAPLLIEELPRAFEAEHQGPRVVAESMEMAEAAHEPLLELLFGVDGVSEVIASDGMVLVRLGRLFRWQDVELSVREALA